MCRTTKQEKNRLRQRLLATGGLCTMLLAGAALFVNATREAKASPLSWWRCCRSCETGCASGDGTLSEDVGGTWYWLRSPEQEKRVAISLYNRYCLRCHGVDGRGVWDIPDVPDFSNARWQASRSDGELVRNTLEGRGACMPAFRGTVSLEEAWALSRYLRTFVPGTEVSRPDYSQPEKLNAPPQQPAPK